MERAAPHEVGAGLLQLRVLADDLEHVGGRHDPFDAGFGDARQDYRLSSPPAVAGVVPRTAALPASCPWPSAGRSAPPRRAGGSARPAAPALAVPRAPPCATRGRSRAARRGWPAARLLIPHAGPLAPPLAAGGAPRPVVGLIMVAEVVEHQMLPTVRPTIHTRYTTASTAHTPGAVVSCRAPCSTSAPWARLILNQHQHQPETSERARHRPAAMGSSQARRPPGAGRTTRSRPASWVDERRRPVSPPSRPDRAAHEHLVEVAAVAAELARAAALQREPVTFVEGDRPRVVGKGREHHLGKPASAAQASSASSRAEPTPRPR